MLKALVVDDSVIIRKSLSQQLEELGYEVIAEASNGNEAIKLYKELKPDFVTMDITMPIKNGIEALKHIKDFDENAKIIMVTSHGEEKLVMEAIKRGAVGYILKPIIHGKIIKAINRAFPALEEEEA